MSDLPEVQADDEPVDPALPWSTLDIPVAVPGGIRPQDLVVVGQLQAPSGPTDGSLHWTAVDVAPVTTGRDRPPWLLATRARRGLRPTGPADRDGLTADPDLATIAADAVHRLLCLDIPGGLGEEETRRRVQQCWEQSQQVRTDFEIFPRSSSAWQRTLIAVDGHEFAWWVHLTERGWAAAADLGLVLVSAHGLGRAPSWSLTLLPAAVAVQTLPIST